MTPKKILIIDDDPDLTDLLITLFKKTGFEACAVHDGQTGIDHLQREGADLVVLDLMMPGMDGWDVVRTIRQRLQTPVIILSALDGVQDMVRGLDGGADDFVTKPFIPTELVARVRAKLRRDHYTGAASQASRFFDDGTLQIDVEGLMVFVRHEKLDLSATEFKILAYLYLHRDRACTYAEILENVWGRAYVESPEYVHGYVHRIRRKLEAKGVTRPYVLTERGQGYRFVG